MNSSSRQDFATTRWSIVRAVRHNSSQTSRVALAELCKQYWSPVYAFIRRRGKSTTDAEDLTQAFFVHLLDTEFVQTADRDRGRFRSYLLKSVTHFLSQNHRTNRAKKRGGDVDILPLDFSNGEAAYCLEPADSGTAEQLFERRWALTLLANVTEALQNEYTEKNHGLLFECLEPQINQEASRVPYAQLAQRLEMTEDAIKQATRRLKIRFRELLRTEIAHTVESAEMVDDELRQLMTSLAR